MFTEFAIFLTELLDFQLNQGDADGISYIFVRQNKKSFDLIESNIIQYKPSKFNKF